MIRRELIFEDCSSSIQDLWERMTFLASLWVKAHGKFSDMSISMLYRNFRGHNFLSSVSSVVTNLCFESSCKKALGIYLILCHYIYTILIFNNISFSMEKKES